MKWVTCFMTMLVKAFCFTFQVNLCSQYFCDFQKKGPRPKWTIYKHDLDRNIKNLTDCIVMDYPKITGF